MKHTPSGIFRRLSDIELRQLQVFRKVVDCGNFAISEVELNISRSRISSRISTLEDRLGFKLMERGRGRAGFRLTPQGDQVYHAIKILSNNIDSFCNEISEIKSQYRGVLRIAVPDDIDSMVEFPALYSAISTFQSLAPEVLMELMAHAIDEVEQDVLEERADICLGSVFNRRKDLVYIPIADHHCSLYCSDLHPFFNMNDNDLDKNTIYSQNFTGAGHSLGHKAANISAMFPLKAISNHMSARLLLIRSGSYIGFIPDYYAKPHVESGKLRKIQPDNFYYVVNNAIFFRKKSLKNNIINLFVKELTTRINGS